MKRWKFMPLMMAALFSASVAAQDTCPTLMSQAFAALGDHCSNLARNVVCYGYNQVSAQFTAPVDETFFTQPADVANLIDVESIETTALMPESGEWGVAVLNVQANVPEMLPGQAVTFLLLGDMTLENAVAPDDAVKMAPGIPVFTNARSNIRGAASLNSNRLDVVDAAVQLQADALSADATWVRVILPNGTIGWIARPNLVEDAVIATLPVPDNTTRGTMQAFYLRKGIGESDCLDAPTDTLMVQGPQNFDVTLTVNGATVTLGSTVLFEIVGDNQDAMQITVLDGKAQVTPDIADAQTVTINEGFSSVLCLGEPEDRGIDGEGNDQSVTCNASPPTRIDGGTRDDTYCMLQSLPTGILHYAVDLQCPGDPLPPTALPPVPVQTSTPIAPPVVTQEALPPTPTTLCTGISMQGPYSTASYSNQGFIWFPIQGVDNYELKLFDANGGVLTSIPVYDNGIAINPGDFTRGALFYYEVNAFKGGVLQCTTGRIGGINVVQNASFSASWTCLTSVATVTWANAQSGDTIKFIYGSFNAVVGTGASGSGSTSDTSLIYTVTGATVVTVPSGFTVALPPLYCGP